MTVGKIRVLFVCYGNICRSPMGEFIFKKMVDDEGLSDRFFIASAGDSMCSRSSRHPFEMLW